MYFRDVTIAAKDGCIIGIKDVSFSSRDRNDRSVVLFDRRNNFPISFPPFHILVELRPAVAFIS